MLFCHWKAIQSRFWDFSKQPIEIHISTIKTVEKELFSVPPRVYVYPPLERNVIPYLGLPTVPMYALESVLTFSYRNASPAAATATASTPLSTAPWWAWSLPCASPWSWGPASSPTRTSTTRSWRKCTRRTTHDFQDFHLHDNPLAQYHSHSMSKYNRTKSDSFIVFIVGIHGNNFMTLWLGCMCTVVLQKTLQCGLMGTQKIGLLTCFVKQSRVRTNWFDTRSKHEREVALLAGDFSKRPKMFGEQLHFSQS